MLTLGTLFVEEQSNRPLKLGPRVPWYLMRSKVRTAVRSKRGTAVLLPVFDGLPPSSLCCGLC